MPGSARPSRSFGGSRAVTRARIESARDAATRALAEQAARFPDLLPLELDTASMDARDAALAHAIYDACVRRWLTLGFVIEERSGRALRDLEPRMQAVLLGGAAQLLLLDRIPAHAAINESVEWAKRHIRRGAAGMTNAVLRKVLQLATDERRPAWSGGRDELPLPGGGATALAAAVLPEHARRRLSVATSVPGRVLESWSRLLDEDALRTQALHTIVHPPTVLHVGTGAAPEHSGPHDASEHRVWTGGRAGLIDLLERRDDVWVQDAGSSRAVALARDLRPATVLDLCAGRGTKTLQLAWAFPSARIIASDVDAARLEELSRRFAGHGRVRVEHPDGLRDGRTRADLVVADVPCSNTGVLARRVEARYRFGGRQTERLTGTQRAIVDRAVGLAAPGGAVLYSTCSLEPEENEFQVEDACRRHGLTPTRVERCWPRGVPGDPAAGYADGAFAALLTRVSG